MLMSWNFSLIVILPVDGGVCQSCSMFRPSLKLPRDRVNSDCQLTKPTVPFSPHLNHYQYLNITTKSSGLASGNTSFKGWVLGGTLQKWSKRTSKDTHPELCTWAQPAVKDADQSQHVQTVVGVHEHNLHLQTTARHRQNTATQQVVEELCLTCSDTNTPRWGWQEVCRCRYGV